MIIKLGLGLSALAALLGGCAGAPAGAPPPRELVFYPNPPNPPRMQFLRSVSKATDLAPQQSQSSLDTFLFGEQPQAEREIKRPGAIAHRDGVFFVTDTTLPGIWAIDLGEQTLEPVRIQGLGRLIQPMGLCFDADGCAYVADRGRRQVVVLDREFEWVRALGPWQEDSAPVDVTVWKDRLYVADVKARCIRVLSRETGEELQTLGGSERPEEFLFGPAEVAVDAGGYVYVADTVYCNLMVWDYDGKFVGRLASLGHGPGFLGRPKGIALLDDMVFLLDARFTNCQIFDKNGFAQGFFGGPGPGPGTMNLPRKIWIGRDGIDLFADYVDPKFDAEAIIAVTNIFGTKVNFYAWGRHESFTYPDIQLPDRPEPKAKEVITNTPDLPNPRRRP